MAYQFYATFDVSNLTSYIPQVPVLLPASSWARKGLKKPALPAHITARAADSGGFIASRIWGEYRYSLAEYVNWLGLWGPQWAACMDYCCEAELEVVTRSRQEKTTRNAWAAWDEYKRVSWAWVPTIQGLHVADYRQHALELKPLIEEMQAYYGDNPSWRVGIGTLCRRLDAQEINAVVQEVLAVLPGVPLHLWGVKLASLRTLNTQNVVSSDSAAWHGMFRGNAKKLHIVAAQHGMNRQEYTIKVELPKYIKQVNEAVQESITLAQERDVTWIKQSLRSYGYTLRIRERRGRSYVYAVRRQGTKLEEVYLSVLHEITLSLIQEKLSGGTKEVQLALDLEGTPYHENNNA